MGKDINYFMNRRSLNIDLSHRCSLECPRCQRQRQWRDQGRKVPGRDLTLSEIDKLSNFFNDFVFCGQLSDPIHHPQFDKILEMLAKKRVNCRVHNASSFKPIDFFIKCFKIHPAARWIFGIDGLPEESHKYRINQDGEKLFKVMLEAKKYLSFTPTWQMIVFSYNEKSIEKCKKMAADHGLGFLLTQSSRWVSDDDPYKPSRKTGLNAI
jgi:MoaA/NifB/PqqE/SkfB family radical SAM enzyme